MKPETFPERLLRAWCRETSSKWTPENPALGQCGVTALVANDHFGGEILKTRMPDGALHFYNRIDGARRDFTASQFDRPLRYEDASSNRDEAMADTNPAQYEALKRRITG